MNERRLKNTIKTNTAPTLLQDIMQLLLKFMGIIVVFILLYLFMFGVYRNSDAGMQPAIKDGDLVLFYRLDRDYVAGECALLEYEGKKQIRRVVAVAGDTVDIIDNHLVINGAIQQETQVHDDTIAYEEGVRFPITVSEGEVFLLGDSRSNTTDSRIYGVVDGKATLGKLMLIIRRRDI